MIMLDISTIVLIFYLSISGSHSETEKIWVVGQGSCSQTCAGFGYSCDLEQQRTMTPELCGQLWGTPEQQPNLQFYPEYNPDHHVRDHPEGPPYPDPAKSGWYDVVPGASPCAIKEGGLWYLRNKDELGNDILSCDVSPEALYYPLCSCDTGVVMSQLWVVGEGSCSQTCGGFGYSCDLEQQKTMTPELCGQLWGTPEQQPNLQFYPEYNPDHHARDHPEGPLYPEPAKSGWYDVVPEASPCAIKEGGLWYLRNKDELGNDILSCDASPEALYYPLCSCKTIDSCYPNPCGESEICVNTDSSYQCNHDQSYFAFSISSKPGSESNGLLTITLVLKEKMYRCKVRPSSRGKSYKCPFYGSGTTVYTVSSTKNKIAFVNNNNDAAYIDNIIVDDKRNNKKWHLYQSFCMKTSYGKYLGMYGLTSSRYNIGCEYVQLSDSFKSAGFSVSNNYYSCPRVSVYFYDGIYTEGEAFVDCSLELYGSGQIGPDFTDNNDPDFDFEQEPNNNYYFQVSQSTLTAFGCIIGLILIVNVILLHRRGCKKQTGYHQVKYIDSDTQCVDSEANLVV